MSSLNHNIHIVYISKADNVMKAYWENAGLGVSIWTNLGACVIAMTAEALLRTFASVSGSVISIL